ncbi:class I SAM-dependent methyltransferase [Dechloromonas sp. H13]|uniref:class I SAM-dependent methyltransferase n=1 Tax=Dechloromonas sp. H13 TaxID=2570193 RepID=UPI0012911010|nr:class I SAM-dependent methyltransferase [Dechloromonas sp. H13]
MKRCLSCQHIFSSFATDCPACGFSPVLKDGFQLYAPDFAESGGGFKASYFSELARLEAQNFWFRCRNQLIVWALNKYCKDFQSFLEVGCGTGFVLSGVSQAFPAATLLGSEIFTAGLGYAAARLPSVKFIQMDARNIPYRDEFDVIGAFDVLEHIDDDVTVLREVRAALKEKGFLFITVPQHAWLWSPVDEYACHVRRYSASELHSKLESVGFEIVRSTSFVSVLLPALLLSRVKQRYTQSNIDPADELKLSTGLNALLYKVMQAEFGVIRSGINLPIGGSRLVVAKRRDWVSK